MASRNINDLVLELATTARLTEKNCKEQGIDLLIYCTLRTPEEQARLYRQGRATWIIRRKQRSLREGGYGFLANIIEAVGPQYGSRVTYAGPGESWHNLGMAFDAVPLVNGAAMWKYRKNKWLWETYGRVAKDLGLTWGGDWRGFKDYPHSQLQAHGNPIDFYSPSKLKVKLKELKVL